MTEFLGELVGTMILIILGVGVVGGVVLRKSKSEGAGWIVITVGFGLAVALGVYAVGNISGAHINPAVTLGFAVAGEFPWEKVPIYISAQMIGAILGAIIAYLNYLPHWQKTEDPEVKLAVFATSPAVNSPISNFISEMLGTFVLVLGLMFLGANEFTEGLNPLIVGLLVTSIGISLGGATGFAINPARDLGPRIAHAILPIPEKGSSRWEYAWVPVVGPILGGMYGAVIYQALFLSNYSVLFWIMSGIVLIIIFAAVYIEMKSSGGEKEKFRSAG